MKDPVPEEFLGIFDIVHIRFFIFVLLKEEVPAVVAKFLTMLSTHDKSSHPPLNRIIMITNAYLNCRARRLPAVG